MNEGLPNQIDQETRAFRAAHLRIARASSHVTLMPSVIFGLATRPTDVNLARLR
jgi:hypothetical protein